MNEEINISSNENEKFKQAVTNRVNEIINQYKMAEISSLVIGIAHQINNPNTSLISNLKNIKTIFEHFTPMLEKINEENPEKKIGKMSYSQAISYINTALNSLEESSRRILIVTENLKDFATNISNQKKSYISLKDIINEAITYSNFYINNSIKINIDIKDNVPLIKVFMLQWQQIFSNFIINSYQSFIEKYGENISPEAEINITANIEKPNDLFNKNFININITDNANGIEEEYLSKIFNPYFTTKKDAVNIGLGLSYNFGIIKQYNGFLFVKSKKNIGTTFNIQLPA